MSGTESEKLPSEESTGQQSPADELLQHMTDSVKSEAELKPVAGDTEISPVATDVESSIISASELVMDTRSSLSPVEEEVAKEVSEKKGKEATMANEENEVESSDTGSGEKSVTTGSQDQDWEDILGNGQLMKKVLRKGEGLSTRPTPQSRVRVRTCGFLESGKVVDKHSSYSFTVGDGDVLQAWDIAVTLMECGEIAQVKTLPRFAYGEEGKSPNIPRNATITYELELLEVLAPFDFGSLTEEAVMELVDKKKTRGNELFQGKEYIKAINSYQKGLQALKSYLKEHGISENVPPNLLEMQIRCLNNIAAGQLKIKQYREALLACESVLEKDPENVKALYRAGRVRSHLGDMKDAVASLQKALSLSPDDKTIQIELQRTLKKKEETLKKEKEMYRRMVSGPSQNKQAHSSKEKFWGPWPYMAIAGVTAALAIGVAYFLTQRH